jgi:polyhydroxyalkanoate synthesis regulator phasin
MTKTTDMILPLLGEMRAENLEQHQQTRLLIAALDKRMGAVEDTQKSFRSALSADTTLTRLVTGEFEERIEALEKKVKHLEKQK